MCQGRATTLISPASWVSNMPTKPINAEPKKPNSQKDMGNDRLPSKIFSFYSAACFIESFTLPLSKPITLTFTSSPSLTTSVTLATLLSASSDI